MAAQVALEKWQEVEGEGMRVAAEELAAEVAALVDAREAPEREQETGAKQQEENEAAHKWIVAALITAGANIDMQDHYVRQLFIIHTTYV